MICIGTGIVLIIGGFVYMLAIFRDVLFNPMDGIGFMFGCVAGLIPALFGIISILIGLLLRK